MPLGRSIFALVMVFFEPSGFLVLVPVLTVMPTVVGFFLLALVLVSLTVSDCSGAAWAAGAAAIAAAIAAVEMSASFFMNPPWGSGGVGAGRPNVAS